MVSKKLKMQKLISMDWAVAFYKFFVFVKIYCLFVISSVSVLVQMVHFDMNITIFLWLKCQTYTLLKNVNVKYTQRPEIVFR